MSEITQPALLTRLRYTPMRDLVRLRVTGRLDLKRLVQSSELAAPARQLILQVVRATRLWSLEKVDVARELIAHFDDAVASGTPIDQAIEVFGDPRTAAKLIRRAKIRNRPSIWHIRRVLQWALGLLLLMYLGKLLLILTSHPSPSVDYLVLLNQKIAKVPADERAWTYYRQALLSRDMPPEHTTERDRWNMMFDARPGMRRWDDLTKWLDTHEKTIDLIRQGAAKPALGFIYGANGSADDVALYPDLKTSTDPRNAWLIYTRMPQLNDLRELANYLAIDATLACQREDQPRFVADVAALMRLASQCRDFSLVSDLVGLSVMSIALDQIDQSLSDQKMRFSDSTLQNLAHLLAGPQRADQLISFDGERMFFADVMQHIYTDDGHGDGRITPEGIQFLLTPDTYQPLPPPIAAPFVASRRATLDEYDRFRDAAMENLHKPYRDADWEAVNRQFNELLRSPLRRIRFLPLVRLSPSLRNSHASAESALAWRDGVLIGITLETYRRHHDGTYPATLSELSPALLPHVPDDPITGAALHYRIIDGRPIVYSVGVDKDDDGGEPPVNRAGEVSNFSARIGWNENQPADGDWILFPYPRQPVQEREDP